MEYQRRTVDRELDELLPTVSAIALDGPKGVGKTATASRRVQTTFQLDTETDRSLVRADPSFVDVPGSVLLDEWQYLPSVWDVVRRQVDAGAPAGRFVLTGSATPVAGTDTHSGAGRILSLRMRPRAFHERGIESPTVSLASLLSGSAGPVSGTTQTRLLDYLTAIETSGFPGLAGLPARSRRAQLDSYLLRVIDRDLPLQGLRVRRPETLRRWLAAYAAASSTTTGYERILVAAAQRDGTRPAKSTTIAYRDHLTQLWLLDPVPGWSHSRSAFARLQQAPKHQLADPALAARLLGVTAASMARGTGAALAGPLFESLATLSVRVAAQAAEGRVGHLRTGNGDHEIDLVVEGPEGQVLGIEVKLAAEVGDDDVRHLRWLRDKLPDVADLMVLTTGQRAYRRADGIAVVPLALLGP